MIPDALKSPVCRISYRRSRFSTQLPDDRRYTPSHFWLLETEPGLWRVGFTRFATRMLGDLVEHGFEVKPGEAIEVGQTIGWIEAFKAIADLYCVGIGSFHQGNPLLEQDPTVFDQDPYGTAWLYEFHGTPDANTVDAQGYTALLDLAIDKILGKEQPAETK
ncbi:glycine cleavage system protein GcvH [soil metagenome]